MKPDSLPVALPLVEAMKVWSEPRLWNAVQAAEAPFTEVDLDRLQREWLGNIVEARFQGREVRRSGANERVRALLRAWHELSSAFSEKVASGSIVLWGRMAQPLRRPNSEPLPAGWARELLFYPLRGTILFREDAYEDVTAEQGASAALCQERLRTLRLARGAIPLIDALREWTDPALIGEVCRCERQYTAYEMASLPTHVMLSDPAHLREPSRQDWASGPADYTRLIAAWAVLKSDFRTRLVRGEFHLRGVMAKPNRRTEPEVIPGVWAADLAMDFQRDAIGIDEARYVAVTATYGAAPQTMRGNADARPDAAPAPVSDALAVPDKDPEVATGAVDEVPRPRGRPRFPKEEMLAIVAARHRAGQRASTNKEEATLLIEAFKAIHPGAKGPKHPTVLDHVTSLYAEAAKLAAPVKRRKR